VILHRLENLSSYQAASGTFSVTVDVEKDVSILPQFLAGSRVIYSGYGTVGASVDLGAIDAAHATHRPDGTLVVTLPHARLADAQLDLGHSHVMNRDRGLLDRIGGVFEDNPTSEHALEQAAMTKMDHAARKTDLVERAEHNTTAMIQRPRCGRRCSTTSTCDTGPNLERDDPESYNGTIPRATSGRSGSRTAPNRIPGTNAYKPRFTCPS